MGAVKFACVAGLYLLALEEMKHLDALFALHCARITRYSKLKIVLFQTLALSNSFHKSKTYCGEKGYVDYITWCFELDETSRSISSPFPQKYALFKTRHFYFDLINSKCLVMFLMAIIARRREGLYPNVDDIPVMLVKRRHET